MTEKHTYTFELTMPYEIHSVQDAVDWLCEAIADFHADNGNEENYTGKLVPNGGAVNVIKGKVTGTMVQAGRIDGPVTT